MWRPVPRARFGGPSGSRAVAPTGRGLSIGCATVLDSAARDVDLERRSAREDRDRPCRHDRRHPHVRSARGALPRINSRWICRRRCLRSASRPSGRPNSVCGATPSTRCARTLRASRPPSRTHSSRATRAGRRGPRPLRGARATVPLQACAEGRIGVGNDLNPLAHVLTAAKVEPPSRPRRSTRLATLRLGWSLAPPAGWPSADRVVDRRAGRSFPRPARAGRPTPAASRSRRGRPRLPPPDAGPAPVRPLALRPRPIRADLLPRRPRSPGSSTARAGATCPSSCRTRSAWPRATSASFAAGPPSRLPSAISSTASAKLRSACPPRPARDDRDRPARRRPRRRAARPRLRCENGRDPTGRGSS
jgi:hypothetical protein